MNQYQELKTEYKEINLTNYVKIVIKRKWLILIFLLIGLIIAGGLTCLSPKTYTAETYLEIGNYSRELKTGEFVYSIEVPASITEKINSGLYGNYSGIKVENPRCANLIRVTAISENSESAKEVLEQMNKVILDEHNQKIEIRKEFLENSVEKLEEKIDFLLSKNKEVETLELEIVNIRRQINNIQPTKIIKESAIVPEEKQNLIFNLVCGGLLGIFIGVFLAFGKEWWRENKSKTISS